MRLYLKAATKTSKLLREFEHRVYIVTGVKVGGWVGGCSPSCTLTLTHRHKHTHPNLSPYHPPPTTLSDTRQLPFPSNPNPPSSLLVRA